MADVAGHGQFEELAAGHALNALEPADEQLFIDHLEGCAQCQRTLADFSEVAAGLALPARDEAEDGLPPEVWQSIRRQIEEDEPVAVLSARRAAPRFRRAWLSAAAAVLVAAGLIGWQVAGSGSSSGNAVQTALSNCRHTSGCRVVRLTSNTDANESAYVFITGRDVRVATASLPAIDATQETYVLWQMPHDSAPAGLVAFAVTPQHAATVARGTLAQAYDSTTAFAISRERGTTIPPKPSPPVVIGTATSA